LGQRFEERFEQRFELVPDDRGGVTVVLDGSPQSHVHLDDPELLAFEYVQHLGLVIDTLPPGPLSVTHVGGAGLTLARYVNHVRPGSRRMPRSPRQSGACCPCPVSTGSGCGRSTA